MISSGALLHTQNQEILLSIKPVYANSILSGEKRYEFRKTRMSDSVRGMLLYASSPEQRIVGYVEIDEVIAESPSKIWDITKGYGGISREKFRAYFKGKKTAYALKIKKVHKLDVKINPKEIFKNFTAPQSYMYIEENIVKKIIMDDK